MKASEGSLADPDKKQKNIKVRMVDDEGTCIRLANPVPMKEIVQAIREELDA